MSNLIFCPPPLCCAYCKSTNKPLTKCTSCGVAHYCDFGCKKQDSMKHMSTCMNIKIQRDDWLELYMKAKKTKRQQSWQGDWLPMLHKQLKLANTIVSMGVLYEDYDVSRYLCHQAINFYHNVITVAKWGGGQHRRREAAQIYSLLCPSTLRAIQSQLMFLLTVYSTGHDGTVLSMLTNANVTDERYEDQVYPKLGPLLDASTELELKDIRELHYSVKFILFLIKSKIVGSYYAAEDAFAAFQKTDGGMMIEQAETIIRDFLVGPSVEKQKRQLEYIRDAIPTHARSRYATELTSQTIQNGTARLFMDLTPDVFDDLLEQAMVHMPHAFDDRLEK